MNVWRTGAAQTPVAIFAGKSQRKCDNHRTIFLAISSAVERLHKLIRRYALGMKNGPYELVIAEPGYPGVKYRGRYCYEHHSVWWKSKGNVPAKGEIVHHLDGNKRNNSIENLSLMPEAQHLSLHGKERGIQCLELKCPACDVLFIREKRNSHLVKGGKYSVCSSRCRGRMSGWNKSVKLDDKRLNGHIVREFTKFQPLVRVQDCQPYENTLGHSGVFLFKSAM